MTQAPPVHDSRWMTAGPGIGMPRPAQRRRELRDLFRRMITDRETAAILARRADESDDALLAEGLHERAADHWLRAERARTILVAEGVLGIRPHREPWPAADHRTQASP